MQKTDPRRRVLVVDDEDTVRAGIAQVLTLQDLEVHQAADGASRRLKPEDHDRAPRVAGPMGGYELNPDRRFRLNVNPLFRVPS